MRALFPLAMSIAFVVAGSERGAAQTARSPVLRPDVTNLALAANTLYDPLRIDGPHAAFAVSEGGGGGQGSAQHPGGDFNGDQDFADQVLHVHDLDSGVTTNLGLATLSYADYVVVGGRVAFTVEEARQGNTDLNGDGDTLDRVGHLHDFATGETVNLELPWSDPATYNMGGGQLAFWVSESDHGSTDLNGDGDASDRVVHVRDLATGLTRNLGLALDNGSPAHALSADGRYLSFGVGEAGQAGTDLNGDGDVLDRVLHCHDTRMGTTTNTGMAIEAGLPPVAQGDLLVVPVPELLQGYTDLNGDGDYLDDVLHVLDLATGSSTNLALAIHHSWDVWVSADAIVLPVPEWDQGMTDLNLDGDSYDPVLHVHDVSSGLTHNLGLAVKRLRASDDLEFVSMLVPEDWQGGTDLNGDGDATDSVVHVLDIATRATRNLALAIQQNQGLQHRDWVVFTVREKFQGGLDLNGDGDTLDSVLHAHHPPTGVTRNLGLAPTEFGVELEERWVYVRVAEYYQGMTDLNRDGDTDDSVLHVHDLSMNTTSNVALDVGGDFDWWTDGDQVAFLVREHNQGGANLNGDGDALDLVLHLFDASTSASVNLGLATQAGTDPVKVDGGRALLLAWEPDQGADLNADGDALDAVVHVARFPD